MNEENSMIHDAVAAMLDGNKVRFAELVSDIMADKADAAVAAFRDDFAPRAFNFDDDLDEVLDDVEDFDEESDNEDDPDAEQDEEVIDTDDELQD